MHIIVRPFHRMTLPLLKGPMVATICCFLATACDLIPSDGPNANQVVGRMAENVKAKPVMRVAMVGIDSQVADEALAFHARVAPSVPPAFRNVGNFGRAG